MSTPTLAQVEAVLASNPFNGVIITRYMGAAAIACAVYDHFLLFGDETTVIWPKRFELTKMFYFVIRYGMEGAAIFLASVFSGGIRHDINSKRCGNFIMALWALNVLFSGTSHAYLIYHHYTLWDRRRGVLIAMIITLALTYTPAIYLGHEAALQYRENMLYSEAFHSCIIMKQPDAVKGMWGCMTAFDVLAAVIAILNSFDRPWRHPSDIINSLRKDGTLWSSAVFGIRLLNLVINLTATPATVFVFSANAWALISIILSRLIVHIESRLYTRKFQLKPSGVYVGGGSFELGPYNVSVCAEHK
ncbi:hypothetical protein PHLGIDRAFT_129480 [Phlebiopsis gigantea 11061_1 CR5-6]|uniref:DUF6533 domain-containing protein n=1 Tax=Phlebiopsis gigantea (strain 11061_1 CR5-6) TaxID=745531 RepID=A0A0C3S729_PHLG1|nr:hypothetical protein PHLGIDRAFT_129480 [Phlebiopsis gigantea 11061_1 CR5-6]